MRGNDQQTDHLFSYISPEQRVPSDHPLRPIRQMVDTALSGLSPTFEEMYSWTGRPSIPPEQLLRALLLQILFSIRSERMLMEQLEYNLLFRWFVGLSMDDPVWVPTVFTKNRDRLLAGDIANRFFAEVKAEAQRRGLLSDDHFTVDGSKPGYNTRLAAKVMWITNHLSQVEEHFRRKYEDGIIDLYNYGVEGVFVINTPTFYMYNALYRIYTYHQLEDVMTGQHTDPVYKLVHETDDSISTYWVRYPYFAKRELLYYDPGDDDDVEVDKYGFPITKPDGDASGVNFL